MRLFFRRLKTGLAATLSMALIFTTATATFAQDVDSGHWAYSAIQDVISQDIMPEDTQGNFSPDETVTGLETLIVIYRAAEAAGLLENYPEGTVTAKYESELEAIGLPKMLAPYGGDVYPAVAYALEMGVLTIDEVEPFINGAELTKVKKVNAAVFFGKALNAYVNESLSSIVVLSYKDEYMISLSARKYVQFLIEKEIISASGDANGNFNPNSEVSRAVLAVMAEGLYRDFETVEVSQTPASGQEATTSETTTSENPTDETPTTEVETPAIQTEKVVSGTITGVDDDAKTLTIKTTQGIETTYSIEEADILYDGGSVGFDALVLNIGATLTIKNDIVTTVETDQTYEVISGKVFLLSDYLGGDPAFRSLRIELEDGSFDFKRVYDDTLITIDGVAAGADDLESGYQVFIRYDGYDSKRIVAYSDDYTFSAVLEEGIDPVNPDRLKAILENGMHLEWALDKSAVSFISAGSGLAVNDIVNVTLKYGVVTKIEKTGTARDIVGAIEGINIKAVPELTLLKADGTTETVAFSERAKIMDETGDERLTIYDLRLDQEVTVHIGVGGIQTVQLGRKVIVEVSGLTATVKDVLDASNLLIVTTESGDVYTVVLAGLTATDYAQDQVLFIEGEQLASQIFEATKITVKGE